MDSKATGEVIRKLRKNKRLTQRGLAEKLNVSDKAVSKWERGAGYPDVSVLEDLSGILGVNIERLLSGTAEPEKESVNMKKSKLYVCPVCGAVTVCTGNSRVSCCAGELNSLTSAKPDESHGINTEKIENDLYITSPHPMTKEHYISFVAFASGERMTVVPCSPEWDLQVRFPVAGHGTLFWYCTRHGLFSKNI